MIRVDYIAAAQQRLEALKSPRAIRRAAEIRSDREPLATVEAIADGRLVSRPSSSLSVHHRASGRR
jgi:hypothetical protein